MSDIYRLLKDHAMLHNEILVSHFGTWINNYLNDPWYEPINDFLIGLRLQDNIRITTPLGLVQLEKPFGNTLVLSEIGPDQSIQLPISYKSEWVKVKACDCGAKHTNEPHYDWCSIL